MPRSVASAWSARTSGNRPTAAGRSGPGRRRRSRPRRRELPVAGPEPFGRVVHLRPREHDRPRLRGERERAPQVGPGRGRRRAGWVVAPGPCWATETSTTTAAETALNTPPAAHPRRAARSRRPDAAPAGAAAPEWRSLLTASARARAGRCRTSSSPRTSMRVHASPAGPQGVQASAVRLLTVLGGLHQVGHGRDGQVVPEPQHEDQALARRQPSSARMRSRRSSGRSSERSASAAPPPGSAVGTSEERASRLRSRYSRSRTLRRTGRARRGATAGPSGRTGARAVLDQVLGSVPVPAQEIGGAAQRGTAGSRERDELFVVRHRRPPTRSSRVQRSLRFRRFRFRRHGSAGCRSAPGWRRPASGRSRSRSRRRPRSRARGRRPRPRRPR